jgi:co-chaperonin GroES (HSP10)
MRALNGNVFIKRYEQESEFSGMLVSDKAQVKSYKGEIKACENDKFVGKEVHVPHYGVDDLLIDGVEYAVTKQSELFAIKEGDTWKPINRYVKIRKCVNDHVRDESGEIALYMTENHIEFTNWVQVIDIADDCRGIKREHIGLFCVAPEDSEKLARLEYSKEFMLHEDEIKFVTKGD